VATDPILLELRNAVYLQRAGNTITAEAARALEEVFADIAAEIQRIDPGGVTAASYRRARLERLFRRIDEILPPGIKGISKDLRERLARLGRDQALWTAEAIADAIGPLPSGALVQVSTGALTANYFKAILDTDPFGGPDVADTLAGWMSGLTQRTRVRIRRELQAGMLEGESIDQMVRRVRGDVLQTTRRDTEALVRTGVTHVSATARRETIRANVRLIRAVRFTATLDSSTTVICASLDGEEWPPDSDEIRTPPLHINCRSTLVPIPDYEAVGLEPPPEGTRAAREVPEDGSRRGARGRRVEVSSSTTYAQWLRDQPRRVQEEVLGRTRARMFREGRSLGDMVRRDGTLIPLR